ncbi:hypothetical protein LOAG_04033 [Loa loa]|uniref:Uncharacterized protein n=1 Tax=Loa loa TaxID=7209 RepID=A0A1S0U306_LOALO|nr:hypothetical protein LOAG_04033 [Loa loa]EFO24448.1 hypothetical protein LOAG_04033 [Loa loa]
MCRIVDEQLWRKIVMTILKPEIYEMSTTMTSSSSQRILEIYPELRNIFQISRERVDINDYNCIANIIPCRSHAGQVTPMHISDRFARFHNRWVTYVPKNNIEQETFETEIFSVRQCILTVIYDIQSNCHFYNSTEWRSGDMIWIQGKEIFTIDSKKHVCNGNGMK